MACSLTLHLFDGPYLTRDGHRENLPDSGARLVSFVALHGRSVDRRHAAGSLWPSCSESRATANLRSTVWRLMQNRHPLLEATPRHLHLSAAVEVDVDLVEKWAARPPRPWHRSSIDLLPRYVEPWVLIHRERIRQRVLHVLESGSRKLLAEGRIEESLTLAEQALRWDPVRESAVRTMVVCLLAQGDRRGAQSTYHRYCHGLRRVLAVPPAPRLSTLLC